MKTIKWLDRNFEILLMVCALLVIVFVMGAQVVARKLLGASIEWSEELGRYLFVWMGFLSISYTLHADTIIRLEILDTILPASVLKFLRVLVQVFMLVMFAYLTCQSFSIVRSTNLRVQRDAFLLCPDCTAAGAGLDPHAEKQTGRKKCKGVCSERGSGEIPNDGNGEGW